MKKTIIFILAILILLFPFKAVYAKKGCCSGKGGVAYCGANGHYICNNGSPSPSCTCNGADTTSYEEDKANGDLYYGNEKSNNGYYLDTDNVDNNEGKDSITNYIGPGVIVASVAGGAYVIGNNSGKN